MDGGKYNKVLELIKELKEDYPDFDVSKYKEDISNRLNSGEDIDDICEEELILLTEINEEDLDA